MNNGIFKLDYASVIDAALTAVVSAVIVALYGIVNTPGFDIFTANWAIIGHSMANLGLIAAVVSIGKDFFSTNSGSLLGIGPSN